MHLLAATPGTVDDGAEPVDPGQTPAEVVVISAADTELSALSSARASMDDPPTLRLANLAHLRHPMSVDLHLDACATGSGLVVARILGGQGYWPYGVAQYAARLREAGVPLALLPGDDRPDPDLRALSTIRDADYDALWSLLIEGGPRNAAAFLGHARSLARNEPAAPPAAHPVLRAGVHWPGTEQAGPDTARAHWTAGAPVVPIVFYRALMLGGGLAPVDRLVRALLRRRLNPLPVFVASLKDPVSAATLDALFATDPPSAILNLTAFATGSPHDRDMQPGNPLAGHAANAAPVFQVVLSAATEAAWEDGSTGLSARDIAMNVALPEVDGRILGRAVAWKDGAYFDDATQCPVATWRPRGDRIDFVADLARNWCDLRAAPPGDRRVALVLANYPTRDGRLANGVGLDTPAATVDVLRLLEGAGYAIDDIPPDADALMRRLMSGPTNWRTDRAARTGGEMLSLKDYRTGYDALPLAVRQQIEARWGAPQDDPFFIRHRDPAVADSRRVPPDLGSEISPPEAPAPPGGAIAGHFVLAIHRVGNAAVAIQPARGYDIDPVQTYHAPDLVPPHHYLAFHFWLRHAWKAHAVVHMGKHGNLEWLPGKALALSADCFPEAVLGPMPHVYPFIVNDPGEGTQAKRRAQAVIVDHLTPPLTRAETYGPLRDLEALVDEYYEAAGVDPRRVAHLRREIVSLAATSGLDRDVGMTGTDADSDLARLDAYLCEVKEAQIRDGLHVFGTSPRGVQERDLSIALLRVARGTGRDGDASLLRAMADDLGLDFDPLDCDMATPWAGPRPDALAWADAADPPGGVFADRMKEGGATDLWRSTGDTVERLEMLAIRLMEGAAAPGPATAAVMAEAADRVRPAVAACGPAEAAGLLAALDGRAVAPAPSGAPTRGRLDVLPTGRNFYSVDSRAVPTPTAWALGWRSASALIDRHLQDHGDWPRILLLTAWGTANMRTGGDDVAQCLALMGVKPTWDAANRRVTGFEVIPATALGRPRVDVTLRISGFFRDAFPGLIDLVDSAARAVMALDEPDDINPAAARARAEGATARVFGSKPGAYGAGLQALIDARAWNDTADLAAAYMAWGSYAYGAGAEGRADPDGFAARLGQVEAIVQNQDNREHDLLDSDDYYQFEGGATAAVETLQGRRRPIYHNDHSRPERPVIRTLEDEIGRVVRSRVVNPKWIAGVMRHGYKGAFEIAATVDYMFAFAATTGAVKSHHFDLVLAAFVEDDTVRDFIAYANAPALQEIAQRLTEAIDRGLWVPKSNRARVELDRLSRPLEVNA